MLPFYFLTILFNAVTGYILAFCGEAGEENGFAFSLYNGGFRFLLGASSLFTGLLKILSPVAGNIPVIGDLLPALANFAGGFILVFEYYRKRGTVHSEQVIKLDEITGKYKKLAGIASIAAAALHLLFYPVPFL